MTESQILIPYTREVTTPIVNSHVRQPNFTGTEFTYYDYKKIRGNNLSNFESLIKAGRNATTPLIGEFRSLKNFNLPLLTYERFVGANWVPCSQNFWGFNPVQTIPTDFTLENLSKAGAISKLNGKINYYQRPFSAQIFTGEIRETLAFLKNPLGRTLALLDSTKQVVLRMGAGRPLSQVIRGSDRFRVDLSKSWLEFRFAVLPLLYDMNTILEILERDFFLNDKLTSVYTATSTTASTSFNVSWTHGSSTIQKVLNMTSRTTIKCGFIRELQSNLKGITELLDENITDFSEVAVTAWELTTLSWLVDYFVNVQQVLEGFSYNYTSLMSWSSMSTKLTYQYTETVTSWQPIVNTRSHKLLGNSPPSIQYENTRLTREVLSSTIPPLVLKIPGSGIKLANIAALISTKLKF